MSKPNQTSAWRALAAAALKKASTPRSPSAINISSACGITADFSRQSISAAVLSALSAFADEIGLVKKAAELVAGDALNPTESRPVLHTLLRGAGGTAPSEIQTLIADELTRIETFTNQVRSGHRDARSVADKAFTDVVVIGIGGSFLGPALAVAALQRFQDGPAIHFVSNIDSAAMADTLVPLTAATTLVVVISKTFTTEETNINADVAREWMAEALGADAVPLQFVAITANPAEAAKQGYAASRTFIFWDGVGGRYSMWSSVGLPIALAVGYENFAKMLAGAHAMDTHFATAPFSENLPMLMAAVGVWNRNFLNIGVHAVLPYAERLGLLPKHLQQLEMESNGKSIDLDGAPVDYATCPVIFGEAGTNGQHSFYQLLHQGTDIISSDIIILNERESNEFSQAQDQHDRLNTNALAQADALWHGHSPTGSSTVMNAHKIHAGRRPVTMLELTRLDAWHLGALVALYENKVFAQGVMWHINSFDQWGVELGKVMARGLYPQVKLYKNNESFLRQSIAAQQQ
jgi:glucose-6-phosphate isomerase